MDKRSPASHAGAPGREDKARKEQNRVKGNSALTARGVEDIQQMWGHVSVIATLGEQRQEDQ